MSDAAEQKIADLEKQLMGTQEILAAVLYVTGEPIDVPFVELDEMRDIPNRQISITQLEDRFRLELVKLVAEDEVEPD